MQKSFEINYFCFQKSAREANLEYNKLLNLDDVRMILPTYSFDCPVCTENCAAKNGIKLRNCLHNICQTCCKELVRLSDNACDIKCPICHSIIEEREIRGLLPPDQFTKYLQRVLRSSVQQLPNTFKCSTIDCDGFHIKEAGDLHFVCPLCDRRNCLQCKVFLIVQKFYKIFYKNKHRITAHTHRRKFDLCSKR